MICDQVQENLELYALGVLESTEASAVSDHLSTGCPTCQQALERALEENLAVSRTVPLVDPPARLRARVKEAIAPVGEARRRWLPWAMLPVAATLAALAVLFTLHLRPTHRPDEGDPSSSIDRAHLLKTLEVIRAPGTREVSFSDSKHPDLKGALYIHQKLGLALVIDRLPEAPNGWKYESWLVPKTGAPRPVEPFHPDPSGRAVSFVPGPVAVDDVTSVAVSMEPENSRPTKPTTLLFAAKI